MTVRLLSARAKFVRNDSLQCGSNFDGSGGANGSGTLGAAGRRLSRAVELVMAAQRRQSQANPQSQTGSTTTTSHNSSKQAICIANSNKNATKLVGPLALMRASVKSAGTICEQGNELSIGINTQEKQHTSENAKLHDAKFIDDTSDERVDCETNPLLASDNGAQNTQTKQVNKPESTTIIIPKLQDNDFSEKPNPSNANEKKSCSNLKGKILVDNGKKDKCNIVCCCKCTSNCIAKKQQINQCKLCCLSDNTNKINNCKKPLDSANCLQVVGKMQTITGSVHRAKGRNLTGSKLGSIANNCHRCDMMQFACIKNDLRSDKQRQLIKVNRCHRKSLQKQPSPLIDIGQMMHQIKHNNAKIVNNQTNTTTNCNTSENDNCILQFNATECAQSGPIKSRDKNNDNNKNKHKSKNNDANSNNNNNSISNDNNNNNDSDTCYNNNDSKNNCNDLKQTKFVEFEVARVNGLAANDVSVGLAQKPSHIIALDDSLEPKGIYSYSMDHSKQQQQQLQKQEQLQQQQQQHVYNLPDEAKSLKLTNGSVIANNNKSIASESSDDYDDDNESIITTVNGVTNLIR